MPRQWHVAANRAVSLLPSEQAHAGREGCQHRDEHPEYMPRPGDRQLPGDELHHGNGCGQQTKRGALPRKEGALVGEREPIVGLEIRSGVVRTLAGFVVLGIYHGIPGHLARIGSGTHSESNPVADRCASSSDNVGR